MNRNEIDKKVHSIFFDLLDIDKQLMSLFETLNEFSEEIEIFERHEISQLCMFHELLMKKINQKNRAYIFYFYWIIYTGTNSCIYIIRFQ